MEDYLQVVSHDAFRYGGGLNKSAAEVYWCLKQEPMSAREIIQRTGISKSTVFRVLGKMSKIFDSRTGEVLSMVQSNKGIWEVAPNMDLNRIALLVGTAGIGKRKREQYKREQKLHRNDLRTGKNQVK